MILIELRIYELNSSNLIDNGQLESCSFTHLLQENAEIYFKEGRG